MTKFLEKDSFYGLIYLIMLVILLYTMEITPLWVGNGFVTGNFLPKIGNLLKNFGFTLLILIELELVETIQSTSWSTGWIGE